MLRKLRLRLALLCALSTAAILLLLCALLLAFSERRLMESVSAAFEGNIAAIAYRLQNEGSVGWDWLNQMETDQRLVLAVRDHGAMLAYPGTWQTKTDRALLLAALMERAPEVAGDSVRYTARHFTLTGLEGEKYLAAAVHIPSRTGPRTLYLIKDLSGMDLEGMRRLCLALALAGAAALGVFSLWFAGRAIRPLAKSIRRQNEFIAAASHELRTPLAVIRANAAAVRCQAGLQAQPFAEAIERDCQRLSRLVEDLLTLAAADAGRLTILRSPVEPEALLEETASAFAPLAAERGAALSVLPAPAPLPLLEGDEQRLLQLLSILVDNALRYAPAGTGRVTLSGAREAGAVVLRVADNGPGIPAAQREQALRRFGRADPARSGRDHYGLGLAIAQDIARLHGGALVLADTEGGGLTVEYRQPPAESRRIRLGR